MKRNAMGWEDLEQLRFASSRMPRVPGGEAGNAEKLTHQGRADALRFLRISRDSALFKSLRWCYQPFKHALAAIQEQAAVPRRNRFLEQYLKRDGFKGLQVGCGPFRFPGWVCTDVLGTDGIDFPLDIQRTLPIADGVLDAIYGSEVIEHIPRERVSQFLGEAWRVLRPGGVLRITTPDLKAVCEIYLGIHPRSSLEEHALTWLEPNFSADVFINALFRSWGHKWLWDFESLSQLLRSAGFERIELVQPQVTHSAMPELSDLEVRYGIPAPPHCWTSSMILEATKGGDELVPAP